VDVEEMVLLIPLPPLRRSLFSGLVCVYCFLSFLSFFFFSSSFRR
jgi:hypothetical protein